MTLLSAQDTQLLHQAIQQIYTLHDRHTFGVNALTIVEYPRYDAVNPS